MMVCTCWARCCSKVHISEVTKDYLEHQYEIVEHTADLADTFIKGMKTYFIVRKLLSSQPSFVTFVTPDGRQFTRQATFDDDAFRLQESPHFLFTPVRMEYDIDKEVIENLHVNLNSRSLRRLKRTNCRNCVLVFREKNAENRYNHEPDRMLDVYFFAAILVYAVINIVQYIILPVSSVVLLVCFMAGLCWQFLAFSLVIAKDRKIFPAAVKRFSKKIYKNRRMSQLLAIATIFICYVLTTIPMSEWWKKCKENDYGPRPQVAPIDPDEINPMCSFNIPYSEYTLLFSIMIMVMTGAFQIIKFTFKAVVMSVICLFSVYIFLSAPYNRRPEASMKPIMMLITMASFLLLLLIHSQQSEIIHRLDFIWKVQAIGEKEDIQKLQLSNKRLIENILPAHVAKRFLEADYKDDELYHEQCDSACIVFASIANFSFSDDDANSSGQSVNLLHDIISDFDDILSDPEFRCIEKIKSTGAVYMAASGLTAVSQSASMDSNTEHVAVMAEFALRLKLQTGLINQRHGTKYIIKIGMSVGPVVAGVIGASKPQYDIWGNTVNVASRMYSTGVDNQIQVTEEMANVLKSHEYPVKERGKIFVKGKGYMRTYFLMGQKIKPGGPVDPSDNTEVDKRGEKSSTNRSSSEFNDEETGPAVDGDAAKESSVDTGHNHTPLETVSKSVGDAKDNNNIPSDFDTSYDVISNNERSRTSVTGEDNIFTHDNGINDAEKYTVNENQDNDFTRLETNENDVNVIESRDETDKQNDVAKTNSYDIRAEKAFNADDTYSRHENMPETEPLPTPIAKEDVKTETGSLTQDNDTNSLMDETDKMALDNYDETVGTVETTVNRVEINDNEYQPTTNAVEDIAVDESTLNERLSTPSEKEDVTNETGSLTQANDKQTLLGDTDKTALDNFNEAVVAEDPTGNQVRSKDEEVRPANNDVDNSLAADQSTSRENSEPQHDSYIRQAYHWIRSRFFSS